MYFTSALCSGLRDVKYMGFSRIGFDVEPTWLWGSPDPFTWPMSTLWTWRSATKSLARISRRYIFFDIMDLYPFLKMISAHLSWIQQLKIHLHYCGIVNRLPAAQLPQRHHDHLAEARRVWSSVGKPMTKVRPLPSSILFGLCFFHCMDLYGVKMWYMCALRNIIQTPYSNSAKSLTI